jgi:hypothetical protein
LGHPGCGTAAGVDGGVGGGGAALRESVTIDEVTHIGSGVSYLQKLDLRMNAEHPPLPKVLAAVPLVIRGVHADYNHPSWSSAKRFFQRTWGNGLFGEWLLEKGMIQKRCLSVLTAVGAPGGGRVGSLWIAC